MLANHSHERLLALRLTGMAKAFDDQLRQPDTDALSFEGRLAIMIDREVTERENRRLVTRLKFACLRQTAVIEDIDLTHCRAASNAPSSPSSSMATGSRASRTSSSPDQPAPARAGSLARLATRPAATIVPSSTIACRRLFEALALARGDGRYARLLKALSRVELLILDDWGIAPLTGEQRRDLLEIVDDRHQRGSTIITSQVPVEQLARSHRRSHHRRRCPRPPRPQRSPPRTQGRQHAQDHRPTRQP